MELSVEYILLLVVVISICGLIQGYCGFGFSLVAVSILTVIFDPKIVVPFIVLPAFANCGYLAWKLRNDISYKDILMILFVATLFIPVGTVLLSRFDRSLFFCILGLFIITASLFRMMGLMGGLKCKNVFFKSELIHQLCW